MIEEIGKFVTPKKLEKSLKQKLIVSGIKMKPEEVTGSAFSLSIFVSLIIFFLQIFPLRDQYAANGAMLVILSLVFFLILLLITLVVLGVVIFTFFNLRGYSRAKQIEEVLPDFLQLTAANIRSGMMIDKAMWLAVRPRFGILAEGIEIVAKKTLSGHEISDALNEFVAKYDSLLLQRSMHLMIEGMESGGKMAELLNKISWNVRETQLMRKEMAASVMTYVIFISFTVLLAAPFLYGLSYTLLTVIGQIIPSLPEQSGTSAMMISFSEISISPDEFSIFVMVSLAITSLFSAIIVSTIQKGSAKAGIKLIPAFIVVSVVLFIIFRTVLSSVFSGFF